ncbi:MAG: phosphoribosylglycinamide formyltransferase [Rhodobiaceae bacterium]|nr:phosphoribosylglycinamide formyltransferase [Rhodobiaceae bacterium]MCC0013410.1 phosphoribosylglycinamide formyltransferase [Rhodobiaceae bacterium]MCC0018221.1 phosphoribosylglycinamide formyltransferase [Rhodobiaceae bacterium]MCC0050818.1 phosphoribosylglycinamide formyltransferase [Rhodobiaceae bacterium]MCC0060537.1 phosphoribosylglycinamide formyltransferase [Rhodobiaceae bacterium]
MPKRTAILISGRGSNMSSLIAAAMAPDYPARIELVLSNRPDAGGLERARAADIETAVVDHKAFETREDFDAAMQAVLDEHNIELVCLAGFMRILTDGFIAQWSDRMINIHPSLLPSFKGLNTHKRVLDAGVRIAGCTVHVVRPEMDTGPIIAQAAVPVLPDDTEDALGARVLEAEHILYPRALALYASGQARVVSERIVFSGDAASMDTAIFSLPSRA